MSTSSSTSVTPAPITFTGVSKFASSLQQVLAREVSIASLPLTSLNATLTTEQAQQTAVQGLQTTFLSLQQSVTALDSAVNAGTLSASVSDGSVASATVGSGATAGTYSIVVGNLGSSSTALSVAGATAVTDPTSQGISSSTSFTLDVGGAGGTLTTITPASTSLDDLVSAINTQAGGQVQATIVNVGSTSSPDYRLSLQAVNLGTAAIDLTDSSGNDLIASSTPGEPASYTVDGQINNPISSNSSTITLSPGLTVNLLGQSQDGAATTITVSNDPSSLASAFSSFATAYNAAVTAVQAQHGTDGGALEGNSVLNTLSGVLNQLGTYTNGSPQNSLANFGITLDETGQLSVDTTTFDQAAGSDFSSLLSTIGTSSTGGFLQTATNLLDSIDDPATGALTVESSSLASQITAQQTQISNEQTTINNLQTSLTAQISAADTAIAGLENQFTYVAGLFAQYTGYNANSTNAASVL
jgi:flagellar hook-associated protein 2